MGKPLRVLIVEDSEDDARLLIRELRRGGYDVEFERVETSGAMQSALTQKNWDLILSDYSLPEFNAPKALELLKASGLDLPFIIVSGTIGEETAVAALKAGANDFLTKGNFARLGPAIDRELREAESRRERRRAEEQLMYHARLLKYVNDAVIATDDHFRITAWNRAAERMYGWSSEEVLGSNISEILSAEITDIQRAEARELLAKSMASHDERIYRHKDGRTIYVEANTIALTDANGKMTGFVSVDRDVTERKQAEEKLRLSDQFLQRVNALVLVADSQGSIVYASPAAKTMLGYEPEELLGDTWWTVSRSEPMEAQREREYLGRAARGEIPIANEAYERAIRDRWGNTRWISWVDAAGPDGLLIGVGHDITERKRAETTIKTQVQRLTALRDIDRAIISTSNMQLSLGILLSQTISSLGIDAGDILLVNPVMNSLEYAAGIGFRTKLIENSQVRLGEGLAGRAALTHETIRVPDLGQAQLNPLFESLVREEGFVEYVGVPLIAKGKVLGVLEAYQRNATSRDPEWLDFLESLAEQASIAIENAQSFEGMQRLNMELIMAYDATIEGWSRAMDLRDRETEGHTQRVTELTLRLAERMGLSMGEQAQMRRGALLHDIGKLGVPDSILLKPGKLTDDEWEIMKGHPALARDMLSSIVYLRSSIDIPYCHHEKWDGTGYPRELKKEQIPLAARIFAVVDVWDALTSDRPYRSAWTKDAALDYIREQSGKHFDPQIAEVFLQLIHEE